MEGLVGRGRIRYERGPPGSGEGHRSGPVADVYSCNRLRQSGRSANAMFHEQGRHA